ncbi:MAG: HutD family protein [Bacteroidetes bacterium]|nr:HutD family protein [Bacteroidota bacterium]
MELIPFEELKTAEWSGGTTTELFIFPKSANYKKMDFDFRISTATIEIQTSRFTALPGVKRTLMVLNGTLELEHKGQYSTILEAFEKDSFLGDWETTSGGMAEDFNLMIRNPDLNGFVRHIQLSKKKSLTLQTEKHGFIYIYKGTLALNDSYQLTSGDSIYFNDKEEVTLQGISNALLIYVLIE